MAAKFGDELPPGASLPIAANWMHSVCDLNEADFEWTIHHFASLPDSLDSATFTTGKTEAETLEWKLFIDRDGIKIDQLWNGDEDLVYDYSSDDDYYGTCAGRAHVRSFRVTTAFVNSNRQKVFSQHCAVNENQEMPVHANRTPRSTLLLKSNNLIVNGNLTIYCKIEVCSDMRELSGRTDLTVNLTEELFNDPNELADDFKKLFENMNLSDVTFNVRGHQMKAHKIILATRSPVFAAMFQQPTREKLTSIVDIIDIEPEVFQELLRYIYTNQVPIERMDVVASRLLVAADKYLLEKLKQACLNHLEKRIYPENCVQLLSLTEKNPSCPLREKAVDFIRRFPAEVMATDSWKKAAKKKPVWIMTIKEMLLETLVSDLKK